MVLVGDGHKTLALGGLIKALETAVQTGLRAHVDLKVRHREFAK